MYNVFRETELIPAPVEVPKEVVIPPIMEKVAWCESRQRQFNTDGTVLRGQINNQDVGYFMINERYWLDKSIELGYDIYTLEGNKKMGMWIYERQGTTPWNWSKHCWGI